MIEASLCAYGWTGPWAKRRGYDSLVQMSSGIAAAGMARLGRDKPTPLPVQALDHATGYLIAASVLAALRDAVTGLGLRNARLSLARTAALLQGYPSDTVSEGFQPVNMEDYGETVEHTAWGPARRLRPAITVEGVPMRWTIPAGPLGRDAPTWSKEPPKSVY